MAEVPPVSPASAAVPAVSPTMARARSLLIGIGVLGIGLGFAVLFILQSPMAALGVAAWVLGAIILHDVVLSPLVLAASLLARRAGRRVSRGVLLIVQGAVIVGAVLTLLVVPEIYAKTLGPAPTVLPFDYALRLGVMWLALAAVTALVCLLYRRRAPRPHP